MPATLDQLEAEAMNLSNQERSVLAERLIESLAAPSKTEAQQKWYALALQRRDDIRSGRVTGIPGPEGLAMVRALVGS
jgi:putative addiction module component (TIGR02574 family)